MPTPMAPMRWRGAVKDKLIPLLFSVGIIVFTSTKSEHSDSPWCEPITPLFSSQKTCLWTEHHTWWGGQTVIGHGILAGKYLAEYRDLLK